MNHIQRINLFQERNDSRKYALFLSNKLFTAIFATETLKCKNAEPSFMYELK